MSNNKDLDPFKQILNEFWLLDINEYSILKDMVKENIEQLNEKLSKGVYEAGQEGTRRYYEDQRLRDFYIIMKEKIDYIITKGLCKKY